MTDIIHNKYEKCDLCDGSGFEKKNPKPCKICIDLISLCMYCENKGGWEIPPYDTCSNCLGYGNIRINSK